MTSELVKDDGAEEQSSAERKQSASATEPEPRAQRTGKRDRPLVLVTGASGNIGSYFAEQTCERYRLRLMGHHDDERSALEPFGEVLVADLADKPALVEACRGVDAVLHLAGQASPQAGWDSLLPANVVGTIHMMEAAVENHVGRFIYASSIHAISGYPPDKQIRPSDNPVPGDLYGVSKCFGEALCAYYAHLHKIACVAVRIGAFQPVSVAKGKAGIDLMDGYVSRRDLTQLLIRAIESDVNFAIVHGLSNNRFKRMDISNAIELLGYEPVDNTAELNPKLAELRLNERISTHADHE